MEEPPSNGNDDDEEEDHDDEDEEEIDQGGDDETDEDDEEEVEGDDDADDMMHALPIGNHPQAGNPFAGRGRGRGRGRGGMPFAGIGHALGSSSSSAAAEDLQPESEISTADQSAARRQRVLDAMASRAKDQAVCLAAAEGARAPKKTKERAVPTLQSLCSYEVAGKDWL